MKLFQWALLRLIVVVGFLGVGLAVQAEENNPAGSVYDFTVQTIDGEAKSLADYQGKALLIVNTASKCGFTPQYQSLQALYAMYKDKGFEILAFPANNFGNQEPGDNAEIKNFCLRRFQTSFPLFSKISVKGADMHPLYAFLTSQPGVEGAIKWNFNKFLVDPSGKVVARFDSAVDPMSESVTKQLEAILP